MKVGDIYKPKEEFMLSIGTEHDPDKHNLIVNPKDRIRLEEVGSIEVNHPSIGKVTIDTRWCVFEKENGNYIKRAEGNLFAQKGWIEVYFEKCEEPELSKKYSGKCSSCDNSIYEKILKESKYFIIDYKAIPEIWPEYRRSELKEMYRMASFGMKFYAEKYGTNILITAPDLHGEWVVPTSKFKKLVKVG